MIWLKQDNFHLRARLMARTVELFRHDTYTEIRAVNSQSDLRILLELWLETEGKTSVIVWTQTVCMYLMQIDPNSAFSRRPQRSDWHTLVAEYPRMGSWQSKGHSKRKTTTSSGFLGRERQVQVRAVRHFIDLTQKIDIVFSLRASSPIWASEVLFTISPKRRACSQAILFSTYELKTQLLDAKSAIKKN